MLGVVGRAEQSGQSGGNCSFIGRVDENRRLARDLAQRRVVADSRRSVVRFGKQRFKDEMMDFIQGTWAEFAARKPQL